MAESGGFAHSEPGAARARPAAACARRARTPNQGLADSGPARDDRAGRPDRRDQPGPDQAASADPRHRPAIDPGYLSDDGMAGRWCAGLEMAREFVTAKPMAAICRSELAPGAHVRSDAELLELRAVGRGDPLPPGRHLRDGQRGSPAAWSTPSCRVRGVDRAARGRRVGDAVRAARQHQRAGDRDGRARGRSHRRPGPARPGRPSRCRRYRGDRGPRGLARWPGDDQC